MKRSIVYSLLFICVFATFACPVKGQANQTSPDLSGTYTLDKSKSDTGKGIKNYDLKLKVAQRGAEIQFTRQRSADGNKATFSNTLYADNRGEKNLLTIPDIYRQIESKTKWNGDKLVSSYAATQNQAGHIISYNVVEEWKLSKDKETLVHTTRTILPPSDPPRVIIVQHVYEIKEVFHRTP